jgi:hypothetical protein
MIDDQVRRVGEGITTLIEHSRACTDPICPSAYFGAQLDAWFQRAVSEIAAFAEKHGEAMGQ